MKYPRVSVLSLPDSSFFIYVPLMGKELQTFRRELGKTLRERGESISRNRKNNLSFYCAITTFSREEIEVTSNRIIKKMMGGAK